MVGRQNPGVPFSLHKKILGVNDTFKGGGTETIDGVLYQRHTYIDIPEILACRKYMAILS